MNVLRTPEERFENLPDYPFSPNYFSIGGLRMHFVDHGPRDAANTVLMLHGEPTWSFLYRKMISKVTDAGHRVIAPDLIGFGKSDKPVDKEFYTYQLHVDTIRSLIEALDLRNLTLFCQDWGGLIGLRLAAEMPARFAGIIASNTFLPTGDDRLTDGFLRWLRFSQAIGDLPVGAVVQGGSATHLPADVVAAYDAPFPDVSYKAGAIRFPTLVPITPDDPASAANRAAWEALDRWEKPFLTVFGDSDPVTKGAEKILQARIPGTKGQPHKVLPDAGHFIQEDKGAELATGILDFLNCLK